MTPKSIRVAAAVIERGDGSYLLGRRAPGTFYAGYWEFPGGKIEPGEDGRQAVVRELDEELGIRVLRADPWLCRHHDYEHAHVELQFFRIRQWQGEVQDRVHDALAWERPGEESVTPMLPANGPVLASLVLPTRYAISHAGEIGVTAQLDALRRALADGLRLVLLREPAMTPEARRDFYAAAVTLCHEAGARVLIHDEIELAHRLGADGVHLPARRLHMQQERPTLPMVAASCHDAGELARAAALGCDFAVLGPVAMTASHPGQSGMGWDEFARRLTPDSHEAGRPAPLPVFALGGLSPQNMDTAWLRGAHGVAGIRAFWS
jgi:8-oxo-dGTP diphosphatase